MRHRLLLIIALFLIGCDKEKQPDMDIDVLDNFSITDINGANYELETTLKDNDYLLFFGFATWCSWSRKSIPQIRSIDSLFSDRIQIFAVEGSFTFDENAVNEFVESYSLDMPIIIGIDNPVLTYILYPDSAIGFPSLMLIDSRRKVKYRQMGYSENTMDSIMKYTN